MTRTDIERERVATYARLANATDVSISQQQQMLDQCVNSALDASSVVSFADAGTRYTATRRPAFDELVASIKRDELDCIVVVSLDRFGRKARDIMQIVEVCREHSTRIVTVEHGEVSSEQIMTLSTLAAFEQQQLDNRAARRNGSAR